VARFFNRFPWELDDLPLSHLRDLEAYYWVTHPQMSEEEEASLEEQAAEMREELHDG
jgi:hypothetical protein